jgi:hypothetical protein
MSLEFSNQETTPKPQIEVESGFSDYVPLEFTQDPVGYFESEGKNIKTGDIKHDEAGRVREDPTAVKDLPVWIDTEGNELFTVGKRVNVKKGEVGKSGDPFYEYKVLEIIRDNNLPGPSPVVKIEQDGTHLIVMERVQGVRWPERNSLKLNEKGYSPQDIENLKIDAEQKMGELQKQFEEAGFTRGWKLKDMVFDIDIEAKKIRSLIPTDWERTRIDEVKLAQFRKLQ